jgi:hypothetical protein
VNVMTGLPPKARMLALIDDAIADREPDTYGCAGCRDAAGDRCEEHGSDAADTAAYQALRRAVEAAEDDGEIIAALGLRAGGTE